MVMDMAALGLPSTRWASLGLQHGNKIEHLDCVKPGSFGPDGEVLYWHCQLSWRGIESYAWKVGVTKEQICRAVGALELLEATEYNGEDETRTLEALIKEEVLNLL